MQNPNSDHNSAAFQLSVSTLSQRPSARAAQIQLGDEFLSPNCFTFHPGYFLLEKCILSLSKVFYRPDATAKWKRDLIADHRRLW